MRGAGREWERGRGRMGGARERDGEEGGGEGRGGRGAGGGLLGTDMRVWVRLDRQRITTSDRRCT